MSTESNESTDGERFTAPAPDRPPTEAESAAAERAAKDVDLDRVSAEYEEMAERGANVKGEGQIEPS
jgi:hypothetical protein